MYEITTHQTRNAETPVKAFSICTDQSCLNETEVDAVRSTVSQLGVDGVFKNIPVIETHHLSADDSVYVCEECGGPCILSEKPRREVPSYGYAHPQSRAWDQARKARNA